MQRRKFIVSVISATLGGSIELGACGDKFLRIGRSPRFRRYNAMYPSAILIYSPANSTRAGIDELKSFLTRGGHKPVAIDRGASVSAALSASRYDILMADYQDIERLRADAQSARPAPAFLPILITRSRTLEREAMQRYAHLIKPHAMTKYDALDEVDRLIEATRRASRSS
jgi:hypothetical protein